MSDKSKERLALEAQAISLGVTFQASIGDAKLAKRIKAHEANKTADAANVGATDDGSQPQTGAATDAAPSIPETRVVGGGLAGANMPGDAELAKGGMVRGVPKSASISDGPTPLIGAQVSITGPKRGRWRAGHHFTPEATIMSVNELTEDQMIAISLDDKLTVTPVE